MIDKQEIIRLRQSGLSQGTIAGKLGCNESYVWLVLKEAGLTKKVMSMSIEDRLRSSEGALRAGVLTALRLNDGLSTRFHE